MKGIMTIAAVAVLCNGTYTARAQGKKAVRPHVLVYKTKRDYRSLVPVVLSDDGMKIVSYPDPKDIAAGGEQMLPVALHKGYLIDRRGISAHTAFLKMTFAAYAALPQAPTTDELYGMILDKYPLVSLCDCGQPTSITHQAVELNKLIDKNKLVRTCKSIKVAKAGKK